MAGRWRLRRGTDSLEDPLGALKSKTYSLSGHRVEGRAWDQSSLLLGVMTPSTCHPYPSKPHLLWTTLGVINTAKPWDGAGSTCGSLCALLGAVFNSSTGSVFQGAELKELGLWGQMYLTSYQLCYLSARRLWVSGSVSEQSRDPHL